MSDDAIQTRMNDLKATGSWWLAGTDETELSGTLTFSKKRGGRLELVGSFNRNLQDFLHPRESYNAIFGLTTDGREVTLVGCQVVQSNFGSGIPKEAVRPALIVIGGHFHDFEALRLKRINVRLSNLEDWLMTPAISEPVPRSASGPISVSYARPEIPAIRMPGATIRFRSGWQVRHTRFRQATIKEHFSIEISKSKGFTFREGLRSFVWPLQNLITLGTLEPSDVVELLVEPSQSRSAWPIQILYQTSVDAPSRDKALHFSDMLITGRALKGHLPTVIREWLRVSEELRSVLNLYFAVMSGRWMFAESRFLNLVQAAEVLHRRTQSNEAIAKDQHRARVKSIIQDAPVEHKEWLASVLTYSNEPRLGDRLAELIDATVPVFKWTDSEKSILVKQARDTRHYLTHYDPKGEKKAAQGERLYWLSEMLRFIVGSLLLQHAHAPPRLIAEALATNQRFQFGIDAWRKVNGL